LLVQAVDVISLGDPFADMELLHWYYAKLRSARAGKFQIFADKFALWVNHEFRIGEVGELLAEKLGVPSDSFRLTSRGQPLKAAQTIRTCGIGACHTLKVSSRLLGGANRPDSESLLGGTSELDSNDARGADVGFYCQVCGEVTPGRAGEGVQSLCGHPLQERALDDAPLISHSTHRKVFVATGGTISDDSASSSLGKEGFLHMLGMVNYGGVVSEEEWEDIQVLTLEDFIEEVNGMCEVNWENILHGRETTFYWCERYLLDLLDHIAEQTRT